MRIIEKIASYMALDKLSGFPGDSDGEESACNAGDLGLIAGLIPESGDPLEKGMATTPVFLPGEFYGQRSMVGYNPWDHKESDTTE